MNTNEAQVTFWEERIDNGEAVRDLLNSKGWVVFCDHLRDVYENKILDTFRRIPGNAKYDVGFRILQGEYQMMHNLFRVPYEIIELGEQARKNLDALEEK
ncbi:hypothetical protein KDK77_02375 [bacterium]|nr:hypothetical protein [bacterium]